VRDTSLRVRRACRARSSSAGVQPHGVDKDERALAIEREEIERLPRTDDEQAILDRKSTGVSPKCSKPAGHRRSQGFKKDSRSPGRCSRSTARQWWQFASPNDK